MPDKAVVQQGVLEAGLGDRPQGHLHWAAWQEEGQGWQEKEDSGGSENAEESADVALSNGRPNAVSFINEVAAACNEDNKEEERNKNSKDASGGTRGSDLA